SGYWTMPRELAPQAVGAVGGVMNTTGNFAGLFGPTVAGIILQEKGDGSWVLLFYMAAGIALASSAIFAFLVRPDPIHIAGIEPRVEGDQVKASAGIGR